MEQLKLFGDLSLVSVFLWHVTFVYLIVLVLLSFIIYRNTKDKLFLHYFTYVLLLLTYIICRNYYFMEIQTYLPVYLYSYYVQVVYLCVYFHFGIAVINFKTYYPNFTKRIYQYMWVALSIGTFIFLLGLLGWIHPATMASYYHQFFFPIHIGIAIFVIYRATMLKKETLRIYFLIGTISYLILGTVAVLSYFHQPSGMVIRPIAYFYLAIIIECTFFAIGLGLRVRNVYKGRLETERNLHTMQALATHVALLENKVLRSQMNSHFIFNVLNSIKAYIVEHDSKQAIKYLNIFSKLMRKILDGSRNDKSTLADELATISLYLEVEQMRLTEQLNIRIDIQTKYDLDAIIFPALLMQPFVENAIWHGLIPSPAPKELTILLQDGTDGIVVEILDNGIGYTRSLSGKNSFDSHRSHGMDIINERIVQFNKRNASPQIVFDITDRAPKSGTRVCIEILFNNQPKKTP